MKNAKIVAVANTVNARKMATALTCAQKFPTNRTIDDVREHKNRIAAMPKAAAAPVGDAVMLGAVESGKKAATKVENYSAEVTEKLLVAWGATDKSKDAVAKLAEQFGKTARSIVAKLSREKVYVKQEYVTKAGTAPVSKEEMVAIIAAFCGVKADKLESLEKANKGVLQLLQDVLTKTAHEHDNSAMDRQTEEAVQRIEDEAAADAYNETQV
jgi:hypothetical protein